MEYKIFTSLLRLSVHVLEELLSNEEVIVLYTMEEKVFRLVFTKSSKEVFDFLIFDHEVEKPVLFGEGYEDSGTGRIDQDDFLMQDLLEIFYARDDFSLN